MKFYYENILANQNYTAKPNLVWVGDITSFELDQSKKVYVFFCIDIFTNRIIASLFRTKPIVAREIVQKLNQAVTKRTISSEKGYQ